MTLKDNIYATLNVYNNSQSILLESYTSDHLPCVSMFRLHVKFSEGVIYQKQRNFDEATLIKNLKVQYTIQISHLLIEMIPMWMSALNFYVKN